jgi:hypothetical protein
MKPDLAATLIRDPEIPFCPIKNMDKYFNGPYHGAAMV